MSTIELPKGITLIAAVGTSGQIGLDDKLPWPHDKEDMKWFQQVTKAADIVIVGHNTAKTLPPLPGREMRIDGISTSKQFNRRYVEDVILEECPRVVVIGGAKTYKRWLPYARTILITKILYDGKADTWMPQLWED